MKSHYWISVCCGLLLPILGFGQLTTSTTMTINQLVQNVLVGSPSVYTNNISYSGAATARGTFNCAGACGVGIPSGVMISTGKLSNAIGPNNQTGAGTANGTAGDADLNLLAPGSNSPQDAAIIQFDFMVPNDSIQFKYVWGSEEYSDYVNSNCNDVFGFFVNGPNIVGKKNIALVPNTNIPISINNVNNGQAPGGTSPNGPCNNCQYFRDNTGDPSIQYDGLTTVLTAQAGVCPCEVYHLKIATQDFCDPAFDSGVFLEGGSFKPSGQIPVLNVNGVELASTDTIFICPGDSFPLTLPTCRNPVWSNGDTNMVLWVSQPGTYYGTISNFIGAQFCFAFSSIITVAFSTPNPVITLTGNTNLCPDDSVILTSTTGNSYLWSNGATTQSIVVHNAGTYSCTITNSGSCSATTPPVTITTSGTPAIITPASTTTFCQGGSVTLNASTAPNYTWSTGATSNSINVNSTGTYTLTVTDNGCISDTTVTVTVNTLPTPTITGPTSACSGQPLSLNAGVYSTYSWSSGQTTASINVTSTGTYTVTVTDANGCTGSDSQLATINANPTPSISGTLQFCSGLSTTISAPAGFSSYLWNGGTTAASLSVSAGGNYTVTVTDANGCTGTTSANVTMNSLPAPSINGLSAICSGAATTLTATPAGANYVWNTGSTSNSISASTAGNYTVTVTDGNGCTAQTTHNLILTSNPTPTITGTTSACQSQPAVIDAGSYSSYSWSTGATTQTINATATGNYTVTVTDANGCTGSDLIAVTINALPTPAITGTLQFCSGNNTTINAGAGYSSYLWDNGSVSASLNVSAAGTYTVTVTDANGCTGATSASVVMNNLPIPSINGLAAICSGTSTTLTASPAGANYVWSTGSTSAAISTSAAGTYTVTVTDANGCSDQTTHNLSINTLPTPVITGTTTACQTQPAFIDAGAYNSYSWSTGATTQTINATATGNYTVTVTDANGCTGSDIIAVTINALPTPAITGTLQFCAGNNTTINVGAGYSSYLWDNGSVSASLNVSAAGTYTVTVTDANGCTGATSASVVMNNLPIPSINGLAAICSGTSTTLTASPAGANYVWSTGSTSAAISTSAAGTYTVTVTDANGCSDQTTHNLSINTLPTPVITGTTTACQTQPAFIDAGAYNSYSWSTGATTQIINATSTGTYVVVVTDANGCTGSNFINVTIFTNPTPTISGTLQFCSGKTTTLTGDPGYATYSWSNGSTSSSISVTAGGLYDLTVTDGNGCDGTTSVNVVENTLPAVAITGPTDFCDGSSVQIQTAQPASNYVWSDGSTNAQFTVTQTGTYTVTVTDANGCSNNTSYVVTEHLNPVVTITGTDTVCSGFSGLLDAGAGMNAYFWSDGSTTATIAPTSTALYTVTVTDNNGCTGTNSIQFVSLSLPVSIITGDTSICTGEVTGLQGPVGNYQYLWSTGATTGTVSVSNGGVYTLTVTDINGCKNDISTTVIENLLPVVGLSNTASICAGGSVTLNPGNFAIYSWNNGSSQNLLSTGVAGNYIVTVTDNNGCQNSDSTLVIVNALPTPSISGPTSTCENSPIVLDGGAGYAMYQWSTGESVQQISTANGGAYTLTVTDINGCTNSTSANLITHPLADPAISGKHHLCAGETSTLTALAGQGTYLWSTGNTSNTITQNTTGTYTLTITTSFGCVSKDTFNLEVHPIPTVNYSYLQTANCEEIVVQFINSSIFDVGSTFTWTFGDGTVGGEMNPDHSYRDSGYYATELAIVSPWGCKANDTLTINLTRPALPEAKFIQSSDVSSVFNSTIRFTNQSTNATHYKWNFGDGQTSEDPDPIHQFDKVGTNTVKLISYNVAGCYDEYEMNVEIVPMYIPSGFTPNNDGKNDVWFDGTPVLNVKSFKMQVLDRWGGTIYSSDSYLRPWDGNFNSGKQAPVGVYTYYIQITSEKGKDYEFRGTFSLVR